jgi:hypothetical protein
MDCTNLTQDKVTMWQALLSTAVKFLKFNIGCKFPLVAACVTFALTIGAAAKIRARVQPWTRLSQ